MHPILRIILICSCVSFSDAQHAVCGDAETLAEVTAGWDLNRKLIGDVFLCEFTIETYDNSDTSKPVLIHSRSAVWARLGELERYSVECDSKRQADWTTQFRDGSGIVVVPCGSDHYLRSQNAQLRYSEVMSVANISKGVDPTRGIVMTPLSMGVMGANEYRNLPRLIQDWIDKDGRQAVVDVMENPGSDGTISLRTTRTETSNSGVGWENNMQWLIDPGSGYLPVTVTVYDDADTWASKTTVTNARKLDSGAYWPDSSRTIANPGSPLPRLIKISTTRLSFEPEEVKSTLALTVAMGTRVLNPDISYSMFVLDGQELTPSDLPQLLARAVRSSRDHIQGR